MHKAEITIHTHFQLPAYMHIKMNLHCAPLHRSTLTHHLPHMLLHTSPRSIVTKHVFCHLQTQIHSAEKPRPHTHTKNHGAEGLCVRSTSQAGKTSGKGLCGTKLLLNELIRHWYAKSCYKERELEAGETGEERDDGGRGPKSGTDLKYGPVSLAARNKLPQDRTENKLSGLQIILCHAERWSVDA